jgi:hypothetical protein
MLKLLLVIVLAAASSMAAAAPSQLNGKSVVLRWVEHRVQRSEGEVDFRKVNVNLEMAVHVSPQGRVTNRMRSNSGTSDKVAGQTKGSGKANNIPSRIPSFDRRTMTVMQGMSGLARLISVEFDAKYARCTATVVFGKDTEVEAGQMRAFATGRRQEVKSVDITDTTCSIQKGNALDD